MEACSNKFKLLFDNLAQDTKKMQKERDHKYLLLRNKIQQFNDSLTQKFNSIKSQLKNYNQNTQSTLENSLKRIPKIEADLIKDRSEQFQLRTKIEVSKNAFEFQKKEVELCKNAVTQLRKKFQEFKLPKQDSGRLYGEFMKMMNTSNISFQKQAELMKQKYAQLSRMFSQLKNSCQQLKLRKLNEYKKHEIDLQNKLSPKIEKLQTSLALMLNLIQMQLQQFVDYKGFARKQLLEMHTELQQFKISASRQLQQFKISTYKQLQQLKISASKTTQDLSNRLLFVQQIIIGQERFIVKGINSNYQELGVELTPSSYIHPQIMSVEQIIEKLRMNQSL